MLHFIWNPLSKKTNKSNTCRSSSCAPERTSERGNVFFTLFGAVAVVGVLGAGIMSTMRGPLNTMVQVNLRERAITEMMIQSKIVMLESTAASLTNNGDCDADNIVEPLPPGAAIAGLTGGGELPTGSKADPWGNSFGYCAWDLGSTVGDACASSLLEGENDPDKTVLALISAGPDGIFQSSCANQPAYLSAAGDDLVEEYNYTEAVASSGGLWSIVDGDPGKVEIDRDIDLTDFDSTGFSPQLLLGARSLILPTQAEAPTCDNANDKILRIKEAAAAPVTPLPVVQICDDTGGSGWVSVAAGASATSLADDDTAVSLDDSAPSITFQLDGTPELTISDTALAAGSLNILTSGTLDAGNTTITGTLGAGATTLTDLTTTGNNILGNGSGDTTTISGPLTANETVSIVNTASADPALSVTGNIQADELDLTGNLNLGDGDAVSWGTNVSITGDDTADTLAIAANAVTLDGGVSITNAGTTDPALDVTGNIDLSGDLDVSSGGIISNDNTAGNILVGNAGGTRMESVALSGDASISSSGAISLSNNSVYLDELNTADSPTDEECLKYDAIGGALEWGNCFTSGGSGDGVGASTTLGDLLDNTDGGNGSNEDIYNVSQVTIGAATSGAEALNVTGNGVFTGDLTVTGDDITMGTNTSGNILIADGTNFSPTTMSGDATISGTGAITIANDAIEEAMLNAANAPTDEYCLSYETDTSNFEWVLCGGAGSIADDSLDWDKFADAMTLDATTTIDMDTNNADFNFDSNTFVIDSDVNRVGIGTNTPGTKLHIADAATNSDVELIYLDNTDTSNPIGQDGQSVSIVGRMADALASSFRKAASITIGKDDDFRSDGKADGNIQFKTALDNTLVERMRINSDGYVGIGTQLPQATLDVSDLQLDVGTGLCPAGYTEGDFDGDADAADCRMIAITANNATGQVGIGTAAPDASAALDITSTDKGFLMPRVADPAGDITSPATGLLAYDSTDNEIQVYDGTSWIPIGGSGGIAGSLIDADGDTQIQVEESTDEDIIRFDTAGTERMTIDGSIVSVFNRLRVGEDLVFNSSGTANIHMPNGGADQIQFFNPDGGIVIATLEDEGDFAIGPNTPQASLDVQGTDSILFPRGNSTTERPSTPVNGMMRYSSDTDRFEAYQGGAWQDILTTATGNILDDSLDWNKFTDTMTLDDTTTIDMDTNTADLNFDSNTFVIDSTNNRVGIGTATPSVDLQIGNTGSPTIRMNDTSAATALNMRLNNSSFIFFDASNPTTPFMAFDLTNDNTAIGTLTPDASAILDVTSTDRGILIPRMSTTDRDAITSPATGLLVFNSSTSGFEFYNGSAWSSIGGVGAIPDDSLDWNKFTDTMELDATTTIDMDTNTANLNFDSNTLVIDSVNNRIGINRPTPSAPLDISAGGGGGLVLNVIGENGAAEQARFSRTGGDSYTAFKAHASNPQIYFNTATSNTTGWNLGMQTTASDVFVIGYGDNNVQTSTQHLVIDTSGNTGIGTTLPQAALDVSDLQLDVGTGLCPAGYTEGDFDGEADTADCRRIGLVVDNTTGRVGIGTASPTKPLHVYTASGNIETLLETADSGNAIYQAINADRFWAFGNQAGNFTIRDSTAGANRLRIDNLGKVGIGVDSPDASAILDVTSTTGGFLPPRVTTTERNAINSGTFANGLMVYNTTDDEMQFWDGAAWVPMQAGSVTIPADSIDWDDITDTMTLDATTTIDMDTNSADFNFDANTFVIDSANNRVGIGTAGPTKALEIIGDIAIPRGNTYGVNHLGTYTPISGVNSSNNVFLGADSSNTRSRISFDGGANVNGDIRLEANAQSIIFRNESLGTESARIDGTGQVGIGTDTPDTLLHAEQDSAADSAVTSVVRLTSTNDGTGTIAAGIGVGMEFEVETATDNNEVGASIEAVTTDVTDAAEDFDLVFNTMNAGAAASEAMRLTAAGELKVDVGGTVGGHEIGRLGIGYQSSGNPHLTSTGGDAINFHDNIVLRFANSISAAAQTVGNLSISHNRTGQGIAFSTSPVTNDTLVEAMRIDTSGAIGIGTTSPDASAILDVTSTTAGFLPPRVTTTERNAINSGTFANGLMVYNTTDDEMQFWDGAAWVSMDADAVTIPADSIDWDDITDTMTLDAATTVSMEDLTLNFFDNTTDNNSILFVDGTNDRVGIGTDNPDALFVVTNDATDNSPSIDLDVASGSVALNLESAGGNQDNSVNFYKNATHYFSTGILRSTDPPGDNGSFFISREINPSTSVDFTIAQSTGNLGIGTFDPQAALDVSDMLLDVGTGLCPAGYTEDDYDGQADAADCRKIGLVVDNTTGQVGIGVASPSTTLHIETTENNNYITMNSTGGSSNRNGLIFQNNGVATGGIYYQNIGSRLKFLAGDNTTSDMELSNTGRLTLMPTTNNALTLNLPDSNVYDGIVINRFDSDRNDRHALVVENESATTIFGVTGQGRLGMGVDEPDLSSIVDLTSTTGGFLPPRVTTTERNAINSGTFANGLMVYNTTDDEMQFWDGAAWVPMQAGSVTIPADSIDWDDITDTMTLDAATTVSMEDLTLNFFDNTTDNNSILFVDGTNDRVGIGTVSPAGALDVSGGDGGDSVLIARSSETGSPVFQAFSILDATPNTEIMNITVGDSTLNRVDIQYTLDQVYHSSPQHMFFFDTDIGNSRDAFTFTNRAVQNQLIASSTQQSVVEIIGEYEQTGTAAMDALLVNPTVTTTGDGSSGSGNNLLRLSNTGVDRFVVDIDGKVGVGTTAPDASALLDITSTDRGFLPPRIADPASDITTPATGLMAYNSTTNTFQFYNGSTWISFATSAGNLIDADNDTQIQVEESADEDIIRFDTAGTERMSINADGIIQINGNTINNDGDANEGWTIDTAGRSRFTSLSGGQSDILTLLNSSDADGSGPTLAFESGSTTNMAQIGSIVAGTVADAHLNFITRESSVLTEKMRLTNTGILGIGTTTPDASSILDLTSTDSGFLPPRVANPAGDITTPATGLIAYDSTDDELQVYNGSTWVSLGGGATIPADSIDWDDFTDTMTLDATTTIDMTAGDLNFDADTFVIDSSTNRVGIGTAAPSDALHIANGYLRINDGGGSSGDDFIIGTMEGTAGTIPNDTVNVRILEASKSMYLFTPSTGDFRFHSGGTASGSAKFVIDGLVGDVSALGSIRAGATIGALEASAILHADSATKGFLPPRVADPASDITTPATGLIAYDSTDDELQVYNGSTWVSLSATNITADSIDWDDITDTMTLDATTTIDLATNSASLNFGADTFVLDGVNSRVGIGTNAPDYKFDIASASGSSLARIKTTSDATSTVFDIHNDGDTGLNVRTYGSNYAAGSFLSVGANASAIEATGAAPFAIGTGAAQPLLLASNNLERVRIASNGSIGIGTGATIDASAILQTNSSSQGFLPPRVADPAGDITTPATGLIAYDSTDDELQVYNGSSWTSLGVTPTLALNDLTDAYTNFGNDLLAGFTAVVDYNQYGANNTSFGIGAFSGLDDSSGVNQSTAIGYNALDGSTIGDNNTALGYQALTALGSGGADNTALGTNAGASLTGGSSNILIGSNAQASGASVSNELNIGSILFGNISSGQIGLGVSDATAIAGSALLDLTSTDRGFLPPRVADPAGDITTPATGLIAYDSTDDELQVYNGSTWVSLGGGGGSTTDRIQDATNDTYIDVDTTDDGTNDTILIHTDGRDIAEMNTTAITMYEPVTIRGTNSNNLFSTLNLQNNGNNTTGGLGAALNFRGGGGAGTQQGALSVAYEGSSTNDAFMQFRVRGSGTVTEVARFNSSGALGLSTDSSIDASAIFQADATDRGILPPRVANPAGDITSPATGLIAYDSTDNELQVYNGTSWISLGGSIADDSLDFDKFTDTMTLDATTSIDMDTNTADLNFDSNTLFIDSSANTVGIGNATPDVELDVTGDIEYTGTITDVSDRRLKDQIEPLNKYGTLLDRLDQIETVSFVMKDDEKGRTEYGVIAQQLETVFPELVHTANDEMGTKSVNYVGLIAPMIEATKELKTENAALKSELAEVKSGQDKIMATLASMQNDMAGMKIHTGFGIEKANIQTIFIMLIMMMFGGTCMFFAMRFKHKS